jgi:hypothetical protein
LTGGYESPIIYHGEVKRLKKKILGVFVSLLAVAMLLLPMSMVYAKNDKNNKFIAVSGTFYLFYDGENEMKDPDSNFIWSQPDCTTFWTGGIGGDFPGTQATCDFTFIFIKPVWDGDMIVDSQRQPAQTVDTLTDPIIDGTQYTGELTIGGDNDNWRILGGTGDLANVHGQGTITPIDPVSIGYEGWIHFGP